MTHLQIIDAAIKAKLLYEPYEGIIMISPYADLVEILNFAEEIKAHYEAEIAYLENDIRFMSKYYRSENEAR